MHGSLKITRRRGGQVLSFVTGLIASVSASANPQGAQVVSGSAVFANPTPQTLEITNSPAAVLNWQSFDIGKGETTRFIQQNAASAVLNRVTTGNSSEILGSLVSNGHVFLINPAGILIGRDGSVDTAGVVLSTLQINDQDFLAGKFRFEGDATSGTITNHGYIKTAPGGEVVLIAPRIENIPEAGRAKSGLIESPNGDLILAAGSAITIASLDDPDITFDVRAPDNEVVNLGRLLASGGTASILAGTIRHSGEINADSVSSDGKGRISLKASNRISLSEGSVVRTVGGAGESGGDIAIDARNAGKDGSVDLLGKVSADGETGGTVTVRANNLLVDGVVSASATKDAGRVSMVTTGTTIETTNGVVQATSKTGRGGRIYVDGGENTFTSGVLRANGGLGGHVSVLGDEVTLAAARIRADGVNGGGRVRVGGGFKGGEDLHASVRTRVNESTSINADAQARGNGGDVVVWSDGTTQFAGNILARGGAANGNGGRVEVSGRTGLGFNGEVDVTARNGDVGSLLLDPRNIRFTSEELPAQPTKLLDPHPGADNFFGSNVQYFDANGNPVFSESGAATIVVLDPLDDFGGVDAGAVYVYRLSDGALLSELHGVNNAAASDRVGNEFLNLFAFNGKHLLRSRQWGNNAGALTVFDPVNGTSGPVDASTSLVGANAGDGVGSSTFTGLGGGMFAVRSPSFNAGAGAITLVTSQADFKGTVSSTKSLVGAASSDDIGNSDFQRLGANSLAMLSPNFNGGAGAVTIITSANQRGTISSATSLVGANPNDHLGDRDFGFFTNLGGGHWGARSTNGGLGSLTVLHDGVRTTGTVGSGNSLVGSVSGDAVGDGLIQIGSSPIWALKSSSLNGGAGAVTWVDRTTTPTGPVDSSNSLVGAAVGDLDAAGAQFNQLGGDNYLLFSEHGGAGAVTFINPANLPVGAINSGNSLVGSLATDRIGHNVNGGSSNFDFVGGKFAIYSPAWNNSAGAVTFGDVATGLTPGVVSAGNSLVGAASGDLVGASRIIDTGFGFALLRSDNGGVGAITVIDVASPLTGTVSASNSLVGGSPSDAIGSGGFDPIGGTVYAISSPTWATPSGKTNAGAVTLFDALTGNFNGTLNPLKGTLDVTNSLVGTETGDQVGSGGVRFAYSSSSDSIFVVQSPSWDNTPSVPDAGAMTWFTLGNALSGQISSGNSLLGSAVGDALGIGNTSVSGLGFSASGVYQLFGSNNNSALLYVPTANSSGGAIVHLDGGAAPVTGQLSITTAVLGGTANDNIGNGGIFDTGQGKLLVLSPDVDVFSSADAGAVTLIDINSGAVGFVDSISLVGDQTGDRIGSRAPNQLDNGTFLLRAPDWHNNTGAVTFLDVASGHWLNDADFIGTVGTSNSLTGVNPGDNVGANGALREVAFGKYILLSQSVSEFNGPTNVGAVTYFSDLTGVAGEINASNSLVGTHAGDVVGSGGLEFLDNNNLLIKSPLWNSSAGAITFLDVNTGHFGGSVAGDLFGALDETNSLVGRTAGDSVGSFGVEESFTGVGYYMVFSPLVDNSTILPSPAADAGAFTIGNIQQGVHGFADDNTVSFVGTVAGDRVGDNANTDSTNNGNVFLINPQWRSNTGAVTFIDLVNGTGLAGDIDATNSIVGTTSGDKVGIGGVQSLNNHMVGIRSPNWSNGGTTVDAGAITWVNELTGGVGAVTTSNSLVGANTSDGVGLSAINLVGGTNDLYFTRTTGYNGGRSALTFINSADAPPTGLIDGATSNTLLGSTVNDNLGSGGIDAVGFGPNRRVMVSSPIWDNGATTEAGAITTFLPSAPKHGTLDNTNSLVGTNTIDNIGDGFLVGLSNGNRLVVHGGWNGGRGAVTFWNVSTDLVGDVGPGNSLVGAAANDFVGSFSTQEISGSGRYLVKTPSFNGSAGALTFGSITTGVKGVVSAANSLVGANPGDQMGSGIFAFSFSNGPVLMLSAHGGRGAVTYLNPANPPRGAISAANSLVGSTFGDGNGQYQEFVTANLRAINSPSWNNGAVTDAGAVTMLDLSTGTFAGTATPIAGRISAANSLVGTFANDALGTNGRGGAISIFQMGGITQGAVMSPNWNGNRGAITWYTLGAALNGEISATNSLVGSFANDFIGSASFSNPVEIFNDQSLPPSPAPAFGAVFSPNWNGGRGAITWFKPGALPVGAVTARNSLVGVFAEDFVGADQDESFSNGMFPLPTGNFVLTTPGFNSNAGAITFLNVSRGLPVGTINSGNSFIGAPGDGIGNRDIVSLGGDRVLIVSSNATVNGFANAGRIDLLDGSKTQAVDAINFDGNLNDDLAVSIPAVVNFLNSGGTLTLQASNDIDLPRGVVLNAASGSIVLTAGNNINLDGLVSVKNLEATSNSNIAVGGSLFIRDGGSLTLVSGNDILLSEGAAISGEGGSMLLQSGRSIEVKGTIFTSGALKLFANAPTLPNGVRGEGEGFVSILADGKPTSVIANQLDVDAEDVVVQGGNAKGAYALLYGVESAKIFAHGSGLVSLKAGTGEEVPPASSFELLASLEPDKIGSDNLVTIDAPMALLLGGKSLEVTSAERIELFGGGSGGAFAAIASFGTMKVEAQSITLEVGSVPNTDAVFLGLGAEADIKFTTCVGCGDLLADPLLDGGSQTGTFLAGLFVEPTINAVLANILQSEEQGGEPGTEDEDKDKDKEGETSVDCN